MKSHAIEHEPAQEHIRNALMILGTAQHLRTSPEPLGDGDWLALEVADMKVVKDRLREAMKLLEEPPRAHA